MSRTWKFTDHEFMALWSRIKGANLPQPFTFISDLASHEAYVRELRRIRESWRGTEDAVRDRMAEDVLGPDLGLIVRAFDPSDHRRIEGRIRLLAVRREERGYVVKQLPGRTFEHAGGYTVTECDPLALARLVVEELPKVDAGKNGGIKLPMPEDQEMDDSAGTSGLWDDPYGGSSSASVAAAKFESTVATMQGTIEVFQGRSIFGPRGQIQRVLEWRDLPDDGRYVIAPSSPPIAQAADAARFVAMINTEIATVVRAIKDERMSQGAYDLPA
ncbi:ESX secretion-associated protein EspG [Nocardia xishanensis]|uniref:ESX secretion-associated protein EspG n=1 Tax=Nocardia xishanensis TaxID=238964 RepID=UPI00341AEA11